MLGMILGNRYELLELIGEGGMAMVYKAKCHSLDRIVAVKILKEEYSFDSNFVSKFKTEAYAAASLSHPNIVNIYDVGMQEDVYYIVMEYIEGQTLSEYISLHKPLPVDKAVDITVMICDGLHHAHERGIIHRDIKPHNILITSTGMVKVADFGIAQAITKNTITFGGNVVGSVQYISPEQAKGEPLTRATDIYSVGCVLYEMLTGQLPYEAESPITIALKHIHDEVPSPRSINPLVPEKLDHIIVRAMDKLPDKRYSTAEQMRNALLDTYSNTGQHANKPATVFAVDEEQGGIMAKRKLRPLGTIIIVALVGLLLGVLTQVNWFGKEVTVPDVSGLTIKAAELELEKYDLDMKISSEQFNEEYEKDTVISQDPTAGQKVKTGREIKVIISKGPEMAEIPRVIGAEIGEAEILLNNEGFKVGLTEKVFDEKYAADLVTSQSPKPGTMAEKGSKVDLMISKGESERISMPDLIGMKLDDALQALKDNDLTRGQIKRQESSEYVADQVIFQDTEPGVLIDAKTQVNLTVSLGPGPVAQTRAIQFQLPVEQDFYKVAIRLTDARGEREIYNKLHSAGEQVSVAVSYIGSATINIQLNGKPYDSYKL